MTWSRRQTSLVACASGGRTNQSDGWLFWSMPALEQAPFRLHGHVFLRWPLYQDRTTWFGCSFRLTTVCKTSMNWDCLTHAAQFKLFASSERQRKQQTRPLQQLNAPHSVTVWVQLFECRTTKLPSNILHQLLLTKEDPSIKTKTLLSQKKSHLAVICIDRTANVCYCPEPERHLFMFTGSEQLRTGSTLLANSAPKATARVCSALPSRVNR